MPQQEKIDLYRQHAAEYAASGTPRLVTVGPARYLAIAGRGAPGGEVFERNLGALYNVAFTLKMASKSAGRDYAVSKLEGLWWADDPRRIAEERLKTILRQLVR